MVSDKHVVEGVIIGASWGERNAPCVLFIEASAL